MNGKPDKTAATVVGIKNATPQEPARDGEPRETGEAAAVTEPQHSGNIALSALDLARLEKRFTVKRLLGAGGMGVVVEVTDRVLDRDVAVKLLYGTEEEARTRFLREARAAATLRHPGIVTVHDIDAEGGFIVMELVTGGSLADRLRERPKLPVAEVRALATSLLSALAAAHDAGIIHRDIKPANILFDDGGATKLADFGVASFGDSKLTSTGVRIGTPAYMAPEQLRGHTADPRADIYAAGATLFEAATGTKLHREDGRVRDPAREVLAATGDEALAHAIGKAVAEHATDRYGSARELAAAIAGHPPRRRNLLAVAAAVALAGGTAAVLALRHDGTRPVAAHPAQLDAPVIAILPFADRTSDPRLDFAALGLPNLLAGELRAIPGIQVVDSYELRDRLTDVDAQPAAWIAAAKARGATLIVRGELSRVAGSGANGANIRVAATLQDATGKVLTSIDREVAIANVTDSVHGISGAIVQTLGVDAPVSPPPTRGAEIERLLQLGIAAAEGNDLVTAERLLDEVISREPALAEAHAYRALVLEWQGKSAGEITAAIENALAGKAIDPAKRTFLEGLKLLVSRRYHQAIPFFRAADEKYPGHRDILYGLFESLFHGDDPAGGVAIYRRLCELSPRFRLAIYHALAHYIVRGDRANADWALARADEPTRLDWQPRALIARREYDHAAAAIERAVIAAGSRIDTGSWHDRIAVAALAGRYDEALAITAKLAEKDRVAAALPRWSLAIARGEQAAVQRDIALRAPTMQAVSVTRLEGWLKLATLAVIGDPASLRQIADGLEAARREEPGEIAQADVGRALLGGALDDPKLLALARRDGFAEAVAVADGFEAEKRGQHDRAIAAWQRAIAATTDGRYVAIENFLIAKAARASADKARVIAACDEVLHPRVFGWEWGAATGPCTTWTTEAKR